MKKYIEREAAVSMAHGYCHTTDGRCCGPDDVVELYEELKAIPAADVVPGRDYRDCRNELCLKCGDYKQRHLGACDGCRWRDA